MRPVWRAAAALLVTVVVALGVACSAQADDDDDDDDDDGDSGRGSSSIESWPPTELSWPPLTAPAATGGTQPPPVVPLP